MTVFTWILLVGLVICAVATALCRNLLTSIQIFMSYSVIMSVLWFVLESPDLAITEAAVGAGITSVLFFVTLKKIHKMNDKTSSEKEETSDEQSKT